MIDRKFIGMALPSFQARAEPGQLRSFAQATGETNPVYTDEAAARAAGHRDLPLPPTFLFSMELSQLSNQWRADLGIDPTRVLHAEQSFSYQRQAYAGDVLRFETRITDIVGRKGGALDFVVRETRITNQRGEHVADLRSALIQRND